MIFRNSFKGSTANQPSPHESQTKRFRLVQYFTLTSLVLLVPVALALTYLLVQQGTFSLQYLQEDEGSFKKVQKGLDKQKDDAARRDLLATHEAGVVNLAHLLENVLWERDFAPFVAAAQKIPVEACRAMADVKDEKNGKMKPSVEKKACFSEQGKKFMRIPGFANLNAKVYAAMRLSTALNIKVYDLRGITLYSSEHRQIGEDKASNAGWMQATQGKSTSELTYRDKFSAFEDVVEKRDLIAIYLPVLQPGSNRIMGVFTVYSDVTPLLEQIKRTSNMAIAEQANVAMQAKMEELGNQTLSIMLLLVLALFGALFIIVRRAGGIITKHENESEKAGEELRESEERWKFAMDGAGDGMWDWNPQTDKAVFSKRWKEMLGYAENEFADTGAAWVEHLHPDDKDRMLTVVQESFASDRPLYVVEFRMRCKDGSWKWILGRGKLISRDGDGNPSRMIGTHTDITARKLAQDEILRLNIGLEERVRQRNEELKEKIEQLAITSKYKSEFLSNMSHELRTPLNSMLVLSEMLAENDEHNMSEQQIDYLKIIQGAGKDLLEIISDILDLSEIESRTVTLEFQDVSLANLREQVEGTFRRVAESRDLGFSVELAPGLPPSLYTDSQHLQQIMKNLLSNAFKFTQKGQISVRIAPVESGWSVDDDGLNRAQMVIGFFITDSGIGLAADKQKIIFEAFQQADTGTARKYGGTGLGLSISLEIACLLGGELRLAMSEPGQGSTFVLYLPLRAPESGQGTTSFTPKTTQRTPAAQEGAQETIHHPPAVADDRAAIKPEERTLLSIKEYDARFADSLSADSLAGKKVLVVDDDPLNIFVLNALLKRPKMTVIEAASGRAALEQLVQNPDVDIVLMDITMPEMDGYEAIRQIRQMKQFESLPIIALTAKAMKGDREKCIEAGASDYLSKPVNAGQLFSLLRVLLHK